MPKMKPCKGLRKRVRITKNGKVVSKSAGSSHRRAVKNAKQRRRVDRTRPLHPTAAKIVKKLIAKS